MKKIVISFFALFISSFLLAQSAVIKSQKIRVQEYGQSTSFNTFELNEIELNSSEAQIIIRSNSTEVENYLNYQNTFQILGSKGARGGAQAFLTEEFIFTINYRARTVVITPKSSTPQVSSLWFEEILF